MFNFSLKECKELTFRQGLLALALVYGVLVTWYWIQYQGIPYVFDNNESFSSIVHAKNLIQFDFFKTFGLTDESFGILEAAHPYVYTHQGNFPRLFAALLYVLGLKSIEWQIIGHLVTINTLALYFAYSYFSKKISPLFALIYCLILLTDYVMNFQWQFNTWRVWHCFFMFSSLMLVEKYNEIENKFYIPLLIINFIALAYFEITYAIFIIILTSVLFIFKLRKLKLWYKPVALIGMGSALGFGVLIAQSILYFGGLSGFLSDLSLTFTARNKNHADSIEFATMVTQIWTFVEENNLVFWGNFATNAENLRSVISGIKVYLRYNLMIYSPFLVLILIIFYLSFALKWLTEKIVNSNIYNKELIIKDGSVDYKLPTSIALSIIFIFVIFNSNVIFNLGLVDFYITKYQIFTAFIVIVFLVHWTLPKIQEFINTKVHLHQFMVLMAFLCIFLLYAHVHNKIFLTTDVDFTPYYAQYWQDMVLFKFGSGFFSKFVFISALVFATFVIIGEPLYKVPAEAKKVFRISNLIFSGLIGGLICWIILPGYIYSAYYVRYVPFFEYITILFIVVPIYVLTRIVISFINKTIADKNSSYILYIVQSLPLFIIYIFIIFTWIFLQISYFSNFQSKNYELLKILATPKYQSASFVSNAYAAPFAVQANQWAYLDSDFSLGRVNRTPQGYYYGIDDKYLWVRDKDNTKYKNPDYFICFLNAHFDYIAGFDPRCDRDVPLVAGILDPDSEGNANFSSIIKPTVVAMDRSGRSRWAIVKLDNDFPPYLMPYKNNRFINFIKSNNGFNIDYQYLQQNSVPEDKTLINIYRLNSCGDMQKPALVSSSNQKHFRSAILPTGVFQVSIVPHSVTKQGEEYWSEPAMYQDGEIKYCGQSRDIGAPQDLEVESKSDGRQGLLRWQPQVGVRYFEVEKSQNGVNFVPLTSIDGEKVDVYVGSALDAKRSHFRVRACNDWTCSPWVIKAP